MSPCRLIMCALYTLGLVAFVRAAQAQTSPQPATSPITVPEVTVQETRQQGYAASTATTATKLDTPILDVPRSIQVVPRQVIVVRSWYSGRSRPDIDGVPGDAY